MANVERDGDVIVAQILWNQKELIKQVPGARWDSRNKQWTVPLTWAACLQLRGIFREDLSVGPQLTQWSYDEFTRRVQPATELRSVTSRVDPLNLYSASLYDYQTAGSEFLRAAGSGLLGDDLGLGKTAQILSTLSALVKIGEDALPALVICPNSVKPGWVNQVHKWDIPVNPYVVTGSAAQRRKIIERAAADPKALVVINIEAVRMFSRLAPYGSVALKACRECRTHGEEGLSVAKCEVHPKILNTFGFKTVVLDEAHRIKDPASKQTRACWSVAHGPTVKYRWALTGTPVANHVGDLWSIMHFVEPKEYPTKSIFVDRYALQAWNAFGGMDIVGVNPQTREEFYKILDARFRRTPKALVLSQLPRVVRATRWVDMVPKQRKAYAELEKTLITRLDNGQVMISPNNLVNATRMLQLSSSYCDAEWVETPEKLPKQQCTCDTVHSPVCNFRWKIIVTLTEPSPKLDAMEEAYDELGGKPLVIAASSRQLIELAAKRFHKRKIPYGMIVGGVSDYERQQLIHRFQSGYVNVVLMTIQAGGTGVDGLQHADTMFCLQRSWSMIDNVQLDGRIDRIGSEKHDSVTIVDFVTRDSIEEHAQYPRLVEKYDRLEEINRDRVRLIEAGIDPIKLYALDAEEARIKTSFLGTPDDVQLEEAA